MTSKDWILGVCDQIRRCGDGPLVIEGNIAFDPMRPPPVIDDDEFVDAEELAQELVLHPALLPAQLESDKIDNKKVNEVVRSRGLGYFLTTGSNTCFLNVAAKACLAAADDEDESVSVDAYYKWRTMEELVDPAMIPRMVDIESWRVDFVRERAVIPLSDQGLLVAIRRQVNALAGWLKATGEIVVATAAKHWPWIKFFISIGSCFA